MPHPQPLEGAVFPLDSNQSPVHQLQNSKKHCYSTEPSRRLFFAFAPANVSACAVEEPWQEVNKTRIDGIHHIPTISSSPQLPLTKSCKSSPSPSHPPSCTQTPSRNPPYSITAHSLGIAPADADPYSSVAAHTQSARSRPTPAPTPKRIAAPP